MRRLLLAATVAAALVAVGATVAPTGVLVVAVAIGAAAIAWLALVVDLNRRSADQRPATPTERQPLLDQIRGSADVLARAQSSEFEVDRSLRPAVRAIAAAKLSQRGVDLDRQQERARAIVGEEVWALVRPGRPPAGTRVSDGWTEAQLDHLIEQLERS